MNNEVKYPEVEVQLTGQDGNAYAIMGTVARELHKAGVPQAKIEQYYADSMSGDYDNLLRVACEWVNVS